MLDRITKKNIDDARDILVGIIPTPSGQVEQITIALIYKFMEDMDQESISYGGKAGFFIGEFEKFSWSKIFSFKLSGFEMLNLYAEGIEKMGQNHYLPPFFRDIFKNAYLPYRDPEKLKLFLKTINEFRYDHSERLGDAFEYLLSIMSAQGDAGQFRTPRHIIDFIVGVVDPQKNETVLDPACGTAGFLISAYKHIRKENTKQTPGDLLNPEERIKMMSNFRGYDISPEMVRLSLVNMFLHGFKQPNIFEYDTLTSEERWNEYADVILANPPFMSPKGGIKPHKKFSVQSKRSEVLFVDYMAEHLTPNGRAGIIVPEGIIFQSGTAYKNLRKTLVEENYLWAVVSLPAGVFNPYSGVKTSIIFLDKSLAKKTDMVLFVKVENDGFDLGAQRRHIEKNDLVIALKSLKVWKESVKNDQPNEFNFINGISSILVKKSKMAENGIYIFTGDRYKEVIKRNNGNYPMVRLGDLCNFINGRAFKPKDWEKADNGGLPIIRIQNLNNPNIEFNYYSKPVPEKYYINKGDLLFSWSGSRGTSFGAHIWNNQPGILNQHIFKVEFKENLLKHYLYYALNKSVEEVEQNLHGGVGLVHITKGNLEDIKIPLPPLDKQREIVEEIEGYQRIIDGARQVVENWKPNIEFELEEARRSAGVDEWEMVTLKEVCEINPDSGIPFEIYGDTDFTYIDISSVENGSGKTNLNNIIQTKNAPSRARKKIKLDDVLISTVRPNLKAFTIIKELPERSIASTGFAILRAKNQVIPDFLYESVIGDSSVDQMKSVMGKGSYPSINQKDVSSIKIALPPIETQEIIANKIKNERKIIELNLKLIEAYQVKIAIVINRIWER